MEAVIPNKKPMSWQVTAILAITILPIILAYVAYFTGIGVPKDTVNEGVLVSSAPNVKTLLETASGDVPGFEANQKWRLLIPISASCDAVCQENLFVTRQVHIRLAQKADRIERYAVNIDADAGAAYLQSIAAEHPKLKHFTVSNSAWRSWVGGSNIPEDIDAQPIYILVDQVGFAMMFYGAQHDGNQLLKDIKRVLRYSPGE